VGLYTEENVRNFRYTKYEVIKVTIILKGNTLAMPPFKFVKLAVTSN